VKTAAITSGDDLMAAKKQAEAMAKTKRALRDVDVADALRQMIRDVPRAIELDCPEPVSVGDPEAAHVVLRCAQEIVTNSIKHSGGTQLRIALRSLATGVEMIASDDGHGASAVREGNGLRGMRERVAALGGSIAVETAERSGFCVRLFVPGAAEIVISSIRAGAKGYLLKDAGLDELIRAIETVAAGGSWLQPAMTPRIVESLRVTPRPITAMPLEPLTEREIEVLRLMAGAYNNREIAAALGCAEGTVKNHVASILAKLGARDRMLAVLRAVDAGYF